MTWHYAVGGVQHGPVDDAALDGLIAAGTVTGETLVWRAGLDGWRPLREARALDALAAGPGPLARAPAPAAAPQPTIDPEAAFARIVAEGRRINVLESLRRGWELVFALPGQSIGVSALVILTIIGSGLLPCIGSLTQLLAMGPLIGGWFLYFLKRMRGQPTEWGDAWAGFSSPMLPQLVLEYIVLSVATLVAMIPVLVAFVVLFVGTAAAASVDERLTPLAAVGVGALVLAMLAAMLYLSLVTIFALPLIIDKQLPFWPAMKLSWRAAHQQFLPLLGLFLLCGLIYVAGFLALCVGILIALPVCMASLAFAYEDLFGERETA